MLLLTGLAGTLSAQSLYDPSDRVYRHLAIWEQKGYLAPLPALRPYAPQLVVSLLRQVTEAGTALDRELAASYLRLLDPEREPDALPLPPVAVAAFGGAAFTLPRDERAALFTPLAWLDLELAARRIRHGNASEQRDDAGPYDDGSIWDDGYDADGRATFVGPEPSLLDTRVLEQIYQLELAATAHLAPEPLGVRTRVSYSVEHIENVDLQEGDNARHRFGVGVTLSM